MQKFFDEAYSNFGVTKSEALVKTRKMIIDETEKLQGLSVKLKSYLEDLEAAFVVLEA